MASHRHHLVSRGYQRFFAAGERILLIDLASHTYRPVGTRDAFVKANFNSWLSAQGWNGEIERAWHGLETTAIPAIAELISGAADAAHRSAAKELAALHLARSYSFDLVHNRILDEVIVSEVTLAARDPRYAELYARDFGHPPTPEDLEKRVRLVGSTMRDQRAFFLERMIYLFHRTREFLAPSHVQLLHAPRSMGFVTSDTPVVTSDARGFRLGFRQGLALGDTAGIYMPLSRRVAMDLHSANAPPDRRLAPWEVQRLNLLVARAAIAYAACHPDDDPAVLLVDRDLRPATLLSKVRSRDSPSGP